MNTSTTFSIASIEQPAPPESRWLLFAFITLVSLILTFACQHLLLSDALYFNALAEQMTFEQIEKFVAQTHHWSWLTYAVLPLFNLLKFTLIASCLSLGYYFVTNQWIFKAFFG